MKKPISLKRALTLNFLLTAIVPILVFGVAAISLLESRLLRDLENRNLLLTRDITEETENFLSEMALDLQLVGTVYDDSRILRPDAIDSYLDRTVQNSAVFESIYILNKNRQVVNLGLNRQAAPRSKDYRLLDFSSHALFRGSDLLAPVWSDTFISLVTGEPSVTLGMPLHDGFLFGNLSLKKLSQFLVLYSQGTRAEFAIIDRNGNVIAHSDATLAMQRINFGNHPVVVSALGGQEMSLLDQQRDASFIESAVQVPMTGWAVWVGVDKSTVMTPLRNLRNLLVAFMMLGALLAGGVALRSARRLLSPLGELGEGVEQIGRGNYDFHHQPSGYREIDRLAGKIVDMTQDIEERESAIIASERRFRDLVNSIDGIVWERDFQTRSFRFVSRKAEDFLGYPVSAWMDDPAFWMQLIHPEDRESALNYCRLQTEQMRDHDCEYRMMAKDGRVIWIRDLIRVIFDAGKPMNLLGIMIDVTHSKQMDQELQRYRQQLEDLVEQRTRELEKTQQELLQSERLAVLGQLTATVSHEIRNPLGTISNALFMVREILPAVQLEQIRRPLDLAEKNVHRCDGIISELLDFSKQRELQKIPLDIDAWLLSVLDEMVWPDNLRRDIRLESKLTLRADPERLRRALINAITNALHALDENTSDNSPELQIISRKAGNACEILIRDNGPGMAEEVMARIYEPMFSTKNFGVGLGVPVIRNIVEDHGGTVRYESRPGQGTTVFMVLPLSISGENQSVGMSSTEQT